VHLLVLEDVVMVVVEKDVVVVVGKDVVMVMVGSLEFYWHSRNRVLYFVAKTWVMVVLVVVVACDGYRSCCGW
jgi:hypothetical protein